MGDPIPSTSVMSLVPPRNPVLGSAQPYFHIPGVGALYSAKTLREFHVWPPVEPSARFTQPLHRIKVVVLKTITHVSSLRSCCIL